jgi:DNA mismatch endonuclease (patch repair protein)
MDRMPVLPAFAPPTPKRSRNMAAIKGRDTQPEMLVRRAVHGAGFRYRVSSRSVAGRPDIVLPKYRTAVFVHGCFWHGHNCRVAHVPRTNVVYWTAKLHRNRQRDARNERMLQEQGWTVATLWECSLREQTATLLTSLKRRRRRVARSVGA